MELTTEQTVRILSSYGPGTPAFTLDSRNSTNRKYYGVLQDIGKFKVVVANRDKNFDSECMPNECKLILRTTDQITDEEAIEMAKLQGLGDSFFFKKGEKVTVTRFLNKVAVSVTGAVEHIYFNKLDAAQHQYLISIGVAMPLFIAPNHPDNGKDAIHLQLAITKP